MIAIPPKPAFSGANRDEKEPAAQGNFKEFSARLTKTAVASPWGGASREDPLVETVSKKSNPHYRVVIGAHYSGLHHGTTDETGTFKGRVEHIIDKTGQKYIAHTGKEIIDDLIKASKKGKITELVFLSHGNNDGAYMDPDKGLYSSGYKDPTQPESRRIDDIIDGIKHGKIKIADNAKIIFTMCDGGKDHPDGSFIEEFSKKLSDAGVKGVRVYGANGKSTPDPEPDGKRDSNKYVADDWYVAVDGKKIVAEEGQVKINEKGETKKLLNLETVLQSR